MSKFLIGVVNEPFDDIDIGVNWENGFVEMLEPNCNDESSGLLPVGVPANVPPTQLDEFDNDEFDSDNELRNPYIPDIVIDPFGNISTKIEQIETINK